MDIAKVEEMYRDLIGWLGEDPDRDGLTETPHRAARAMRFLTSGYGQKPEELINHACFPAETNSMVIVRDIELYSLCEHHLLPFFGRCHIGYIPKGRVVGVSKLARLVDMYARRLQIQERLTEQIAHVIMDHIKPEGVGVIIEARHLCMMMRGVQKQNSMLVTSAVLGSFRESENTRHEFLSLIGRERSV